MISLYRKHTALSFNGCAVTGIWFGVSGEWIRNATVGMKHCCMSKHVVWTAVAVALLCRQLAFQPY